ncbi:YiiX/YebB-like N1pC/P60 family cysteine hydrolase [Roseicyclus persicicus]|uniref:Permuted papain-like amidase YaeF/Yiix C92 family enzyme n=1 Tax=Roseicyclus persicicus TaxID=2650661 RepID=A0A7X6H176_9RHOB|nr:YiiX/YebB-like N1pC/P60 family cysteine hydrolase [Roseibacterium persicicum]NKX46171.1 hypothetical protein [Roseibacterium persicicum]
MRNAIFGLALLAAVPVGCAAPDPSAVDPARPLSDCCQRGVERLPDWLVAVADRNTALTLELGLVQFRPGRLTEQPEAMALLTGALRPLDVLAFHSPNRMSGLVLPGLFTHAAIYLGTESQLRDAGLWDHPALRPHQPAIAAGAIYLEAVNGGVQLHGPDIVLDTDAVAVLRPARTDRAAALGRALARMGTPFDMRFDATDPSALFCAELVALTFPAAPLPRTAIYGRETILIDSLVAGALDDTLPFGFVGFVEATPGGGARALSQDDLARRLLAEWPA